MSTARVARSTGAIAVVLGGAIFGFFYAWVCSTLWGLDQVHPAVAIEAMNGMNASVQNALFFPAFFLTPVAFALAAVLALMAKRRVAALLFGGGALLLLLGVIVVTGTQNVPLNNWLAEVGPPVEASAGGLEPEEDGSIGGENSGAGGSGTIEPEAASAAAIWERYSGSWQAWNAVRAVSGGLALTLGAVALLLLGSRGARDTDLGQSG
ncbi:MAG: anthrone oxygenase family protein [Cumulibacter sp.]